MIKLFAGHHEDGVEQVIEFGPQIKVTQTGARQVAGGKRGFARKAKVEQIESEVEIVKNADEDVEVAEDGHNVVGEHGFAQLERFTGFHPRRTKVATDEQVDCRRNGHLVQPTGSEQKVLRARIGDLLPVPNEDIVQPRGDGHGWLVGLVGGVGWQ